MQLEDWVRSKPRCPNDHGECVPDFSCCKPKLMWDSQKRTKFKNAEQGEREKMMMGALTAAVEEMAPALKFE